MKFNEDLASIHGYLCADGYVIRNPKSQEHKYYHIGLRNTNSVLLKDFQKKFKRFFGIVPIIKKDGRAKVQNKNIYKKLTESYNYYSDKWSIPKLPKKLAGAWLRSYFDCDGWVTVTKGKDRKIGLESINSSGLLQIKDILYKKFRITSTVKKKKNRNICRMYICGKDDLIKFSKNIGFLHPKKKAKLQEAINSYKNYVWSIPKTKKALFSFIREKGKERRERGQIRFYSIIRKNLINLNKALRSFNVESRVSKRFTNGYGSHFYTLSLRIKEVNKFK